MTNTKELPAAAITSYFVGNQEFELKDFEGKRYLVTVSRGVTYTLDYNASGWCVMSARNSMSKGIGSVRWFDSPEEVAAKIKAFRGADLSALM